MTLLCQEQCTPAVSVLKDRGEHFAFRFVGITMDSVASPQPVVRFFDVLSWRKELRTDGKWTGFHKLAAKVCPTHSRWLKIAVADSGGDPKRPFLQVAAEC